VQAVIALIEVPAQEDESKVDARSCACLNMHGCTAWHLLILCHAAGCCCMLRSPPLHNTAEQHSSSGSVRINGGNSSRRS
jgi:hypothetical protein